MPSDKKKTRKLKKNVSHTRRRKMRGGSDLSEDNSFTFYGYDIPSDERDKILNENPAGTKVYLQPENQEDMRTLTITLDENGNKEFTQTGDMYGDFENPNHPDYIGGNKTQKRTSKKIKKSKKKSNKKDKKDKKDKKEKNKQSKK